MVKAKTFFEDGIWWLINSSYFLVGYLVPFFAIVGLGSTWFSDLHHLAIWWFSASFIAGGLLLIDSCMQKGSVIKVFSGLLLCAIGCLYMV